VLIKLASSAREVAVDALDAIGASVVNANVGCLCESRVNESERERPLNLQGTGVLHRRRTVRDELVAITAASSVECTESLRFVSETDGLALMLINDESDVRAALTEIERSCSTPVQPYAIESTVGPCVQLVM